MKRGSQRSCAFPQSHLARPSQRRGLTLIELVIVLVVIAILAALLIPRLGNMDRNAKLTASISNLHETTKMLEVFKTVSKGKIPDGFDSLLDGSGAIYAGNGNPMQNSGVFASWLTAGPLTANELGSLRRVSSNVVAPGGPANSLITLYDHDTAATNAQQSTDAATARTLATSGNVAFVNPASSAGTAIYQAFGFSTTDTSFRLVAVGIGPRCTLVGRNAYNIAISEATVADDISPNSEFAYRRPVALIRVSDTTPQYFAEFIGTVTSYGKTPAQLRTFIQ